MSTSRALCRALQVYEPPEFKCVKKIRVETNSQAPDRVLATVSRVKLPDRIYHLAEASNWPLIQRDGLFCAR